MEPRRFLNRLIAGARLPLWIATLTVAAVCAPAQITTIGMYPSEVLELPEFADFWQACGYNMLEMVDGGSGKPAGQLTQYYATLATQVAAAQAKGFKVYILLLSNVNQDAAGTGQPALFSPIGEPAKYQARLGYIRQAVKALKGADGFSLLAADPGGDPQGLSTTQSFYTMAREVKAIINQEAPDKHYIINNWGLLAWKHVSVDPFTVGPYQEQIQLADEMLNEPNLIGPDCGVEIVAENDYLYVPPKVYKEANLPLEYYPHAEDIAPLISRGTKQIWGWPFFIIDEFDSGINYWYQTSGLMGAETRFIYNYIHRLRGTGVNGMIGFVFDGKAEALNTYAFGRMSQSDAVTPTGVIDEFAGLIADRATSATLGQILRYTENLSSWARYFVEPYIPAPLEAGGLETANLALVRLRRVVPRANPTFPLPEKPADYLARVRERLEVLASEETIKPAVSRDHSGGELFGLAGTNWAGDEHTADGLDQALGSPEDRACAVVSTAAPYPARLRQPLMLRRGHRPATITIGYRANPLQTAAGSVYWDDTLLGTINANQTGEGLRTAQLAVPAGADFARGVHVLTLSVAGPASPARYFEIDAVLVPDTPTTYQPGFTWDFKLDYDRFSASPDDAGSLAAAANAGLNNGPARADTWLMGYCPAPFNPANVARLSDRETHDPYGITHVKPGNESPVGMIKHPVYGNMLGPQIGRVGDNGANPNAWIGIVAPVGSIYIEGLGSGAGSTPALIAFAVPEDGRYDIAFKLKASGGAGAATVYHGEAEIGARQTGSNKRLMTWQINSREAKSGDRFYFVVESTLNPNGSENVLEELKITRTPRNGVAHCEGY